MTLKKHALIIDGAEVKIEVKSGDDKHKQDDSSASENGEMF